MGRQPGEQSRGLGRGTGARATFGLAWSVCLLCVALAAGSLLLASLNGRTLGEIFFEEGLITLAILTATFCVVGALATTVASASSKTVTQAARAAASQRPGGPSTTSGGVLTSASCPPGRRRTSAAAAERGQVA